jgi:hypothetical protein
MLQVNPSGPTGRPLSPYPQNPAIFLLDRDDAQIQPAAVLEMHGVRSLGGQDGALAPPCFSLVVLVHDPRLYHGARVQPSLSARI